MITANFSGLPHGGGGMQTQGWQADDMPRVEFSCGKAEGQYHKKIVAMDAVIQLPDHTYVNVDNICFLGITGAGNIYRFSGRIKKSLSAPAVSATTPAPEQKGEV